jgi:hypothetical protein
MNKTSSEDENLTYNKNYIGIAKLMHADVNVLAIQFDIAISRENWVVMSVEERIQHCMIRFNERIENTLFELERYIRQQGQDDGQKD